MSLLKTYWLLITLACVCGGQTPATGTLELHQGKVRLELPRVGIEYFGPYRWDGPTAPMYLPEFNSPSYPAARIQFSGDSLRLKFWAKWDGAEGWETCNCKIQEP